MGRGIAARAKSGYILPPEWLPRERLGAGTHCEEAMARFGYSGWTPCWKNFKKKTKTLVALQASSTEESAQDFMLEPAFHNVLVHMSWAVAQYSQLPMPWFAA